MFNSISFKVVKIKDYLASFLFILIFLLLIIFSNEAFTSAKKGIELFLYNVLPSIFPFLIISNIITQTNIVFLIDKLLSPITKKLFNLPGISSIPIILGIFSGYPIGAKIVKDLYERKLISKNNANTLLAFTNNSGPLFIVSFIGISLYHDTKTGILLLITHIISAIIVGLILTNFNKKISYDKEDINISNNKSSLYNSNKNIANIVVDSVKDSVNTSLFIGGFIIFFSVIICLLTNSFFFDILSKPINYILSLFNISSITTIPFLQGVIEMTNGINSISTLNTIPYIYKISITAFILGIGGLSIYMQLLSIISTTDLSTKKYIIGKIMHGIISCALTYVLIKYTPFFNLGSIETYVKPYTSVENIVTVSEINIFLDIISFCFISIVIYKMYSIRKNAKKYSKENIYKI